MLRASTTLSPSFLRAVVLLTGFKPRRMVRVQGALLLMALEGGEVTAAEIPAELTNRDDGTPDRHIAGAATGALVALGLLEVVRRIKSPNPSAKGRKLDVLRAPNPGKVRAWLRANEIQHGAPEVVSSQQSAFSFSEPAMAEAR